MIVFLY